MSLVIDAAAAAIEQRVRRGEESRVEGRGGGEEREGYRGKRGRRKKG